MDFRVIPSRIFLNGRDNRTWTLRMVASSWLKMRWKPTQQQTQEEEDVELTPAGQRQLQAEGLHQAMAMAPPGGSGFGGVTEVMETTQIEGEMDLIAMQMMPQMLEKMWRKKAMVAMEMRMKGPSVRRCRTRDNDQLGGILKTDEEKGIEAGDPLPPEVELAELTDRRGGGFNNETKAAVDYEATKSTGYEATFPADNGGSCCQADDSIDSTNCWVRFQFSTWSV
eukprot:s652_g22.t1